MKLRSNTKKLFKKIKSTIASSPPASATSIHDREIARYFADGGDEMFRYNFELTSESLVIDLGGYLGQWTSDIYAMYNCKILVFEPVGVFFEKIFNRFKLNKNITVFNYGLGSSKKQEIINLSQDGSSVFIESEHKEIINFEDIAAFFKLHNITSVDLIKINIEGGEYDVLPRLIESGLINKVRRLQIQFHELEEDSLSKMNKIHEGLMLSHQLLKQYTFVWEDWILK